MLGQIRALLWANILVTAIVAAGPAVAGGIQHQLGPASLTANGYVTTGAQAFNGIKTFDDAPVMSGASVTNLNMDNAASGTLAVARGGTGSTTQNFVDLSTNQNVSGLKTFTSSLGVSISAYLAIANGYTSYRNLSTGSVYGTSGGGSWPFTEAGHLVLEGRQNGANRGAVFIGPSGVAAALLVGTGTPEGVRVASPGSIYLRTDGGAATSFYVKESGSATNTGWVAK